MFDRLAHLLLRHSTKLPAEVADVIEGASIFERSSDPEDGAPRVFVQMGGPLHGAFRFDDDTAREKIAARWPYLSEKQLVNAVAMLDGRVTAALRKPGGAKRRNWVRDYGRPATDLET